MAKVDELVMSGINVDPGYREVYPWHAETWSRLTRDPARLPHALLLRGPAGLGKQAFVWRLAYSLLCLYPINGFQACGECRGCQLFRAGTHPDLTVVGPLEDKEIIGVDQIRALQEYLSLRPHLAARKIVLLNPAEAMNVNAANSLLKMLEEPPLGSMLMLVASHPARLPATVRSRCAAVPFRVPGEAEALRWLSEQLEIGAQAVALLALSGGAPLTALRRGPGFLKLGAQLRQDMETLRAGRGDVVECAARWQAIGADNCLASLQLDFASLIKSGLNRDQTNINNINMLLNIFSVAVEARKRIRSSIDETLLLEEVLIGCARESGSHLR